MLSRIFLVRVLFLSVHRTDDTVGTGWPQWPIACPSEVLAFCSVPASSPLCHAAVRRVGCPELIMSSLCPVHAMEQALGDDAHITLHGDQDGDMSPF